MADKIVQVEEFCIHSKILGRYQTRLDKAKNNNNFDVLMFDLVLYLVCHFFKGCIAYFLIIVVEIDKKIRFHKILGLEYMMKMKKYSNTEYLVKSWIMIIIGIVALIVAFFQTIYNALKGNMGAKYVGIILTIQ